jgi:glycosyltransferase involved in cell wall biosynthesis
VRIGMFADMYKPHLSGVTNYISLYKRRFEELGHEVFVFTFGNLDYVDTETNILRSPALPWGSTGWQLGLRIPARTRELMGTLDIAHVHHPFLSGRVVLRHCAPHGIPVVFTNHTRYDIYSDAYAGMMPRTIRMAFLRRYLRHFAAEVDLVIAPSPGIREWLAEFGVTDGAVELSNCVDTEPFMHPAHPKDRGEFGFAGDSVVFCYLGRLGPEKNLSLLVDAFIRVAESEPHACLLLLGDGPSRSEAQEKLRAHGLTGRVHFAGRTPYESVPDLLAAADVFVTPSVSEVHPLVVMEAMAAGLPVIGVHSPGVGDIVRDGETGFLTHGDAPGFASRMLELARDPDVRTRLAGAARADAANYDIRIMADRMLEHYRRLVEYAAANPVVR